MGAVGIVATIALFPGVGLAAFDHLLALIVGTSDRHADHRTPFQEQGLPWHTFQFKYRSVTPPNFAGRKSKPACVRSTLAPYQPYSTPEDTRFHSSPRPTFCTGFSIVTIRSHPLAN